MPRRPSLRSELPFLRRRFVQCLTGHPADVGSHTTEQERSTSDRRKHVEPPCASTWSSVTIDICSGGAHGAIDSSRRRRLVHRWVRRSTPPSANRSNATYGAGTLATSWRALPIIAPLPAGSDRDGPRSCPPGHLLVLSGADQHRLRPRAAPPGGVHPWPTSATREDLTLVGGPT
jgi:hypothetical protein